MRFHTYISVLGPRMFRRSCSKIYAIIFSSFSLDTFHCDGVFIDSGGSMVSMRYSYEPVWNSISEDRLLVVSFPLL